MSDIATARTVYLWAEKLRCAQLNALQQLNFFYSGLRENFDLDDKIVIPRGMADMPSRLSHVINDLHKLTASEPDDLWDVIVDVEWILGASARPVRCHDFFVNTAIAACTHWAEKTLHVVSNVAEWYDWGEDNPAPAPNWAFSYPEKEQFARYLSSCRWALKELGFLTATRLEWLHARMTSELLCLEREFLARSETRYFPTHTEDCILRALIEREPQTQAELAQSALGADGAEGNLKKALATMVKKGFLIPGKGRGSQGYRLTDSGRLIVDGTKE